MPHLKNFDFSNLSYKETVSLLITHNQQASTKLLLMIFLWLSLYVYTDQFQKYDI